MLTFNENPRELTATRFGAGFQLLLPATITLVAAKTDKPRIVLSNLRISILVQNRQLEWIGMGVARDETTYIAADAQVAAPGNLIWRDSLETLGRLESIRDGGEPAFQMNAEGELSRLVHCPSHDDWQYVRGISSQWHDSAIVRYPKEVWGRMISSLGVSHNLYLEIPLSANPGGTWDEVWKRLDEAKRAFNQGGSTGWNACVAACRKTLESWKQVQPEDLGSERARDQNQDQRVDRLRHCLIDYAHLAPHSSDDEWTRDDALLALSTLIALLNKRKP